MEWAVLILLFGVASFAIARGARRQRHEALDRAAADLGLTRSPRDELVGSFGEPAVDVRVHERDRGGSGSVEWWTIASARVRGPLPAGLSVAPEDFFGGLFDAFGFTRIQLGSRLDRELRIRGAHAEEIRELLTDPEVQACLGALLTAQGGFHLRDGDLTIERCEPIGDGTRSILEELVRLVLGLEAARRGSWEAFAEGQGLALDWGALRLTGEMRGVPLTIQGLSGGPTTIRAQLARVLPAATRVVRKESAKSGGALGDPVLDSLVSVQTDDLAVLRQRLCTEDVRGALLEVVHGFPGSSVRSDVVELWCPHWVGLDLHARVDLVLQLVRCLDDG
ncbi:MAG: hypothetical protein KTR31_11515 [Myxococcales bacterium]|nr:hypothetical protein [Myxococcales bacterium]